MKTFANIVGKEENYGNQHFLLFPKCFLLYRIHASSIKLQQYMCFLFLFPKTFNLFDSKIWHFLKSSKFKSLPNDKFLDRTKLEAFADGKLKGCFNDYFSL